MKLVLPNNNQPERQYAAYILLKHLLDLDFELLYNDQQNSTIELSNGKSIVIKDHFFNKYPSPKSYLCHEAIPQEVVFASKSQIPFLAESDLPIVFGTDQFELNSHQLILGIDVFAIAFYCLSRWEEAANPHRDVHERFPAQASLAYKNNYLQRPIVNELASLLGNLISYLGEAPVKPNRKFEFWPTHDVDILFRWPNWHRLFKMTAGDLFKRHDIKSAYFNFNQGLRHFVNKTPDPYDTYDTLMDLSELYGFKSHFYFLAGGISTFDNDMENGIYKARPIMEKVAARGHIVGIHPSYHSAADKSIFDKEVNRFKSLSTQVLRYGRQHFLRFNIEKTWGFWEQNDLEIDSTLGYPEISGFRCGICTPFPVFDLNLRKRLKLIEAPLTAMDATYAVYQKARPETMEAELLSLLKTVKKYSGTFVLLWHNSSFNVPEYQPYSGIYERVLAAASANL